MENRSIPVVRLEVEYMKHAILHAFTDMQLRLDKDCIFTIRALSAPRTSWKSSVTRRRKQSS